MRREEDELENLHHILLAEAKKAVQEFNLLTTRGTLRF